MNDDDLLALAHKRYEQAEAFERINFEKADEDLKFAAGDHWDPTVRAARQAAGQPCLSINRLPQFISLVVNEARKNAPAIKVHPVDDHSDRETAKIFEGLIRNIEAQSNAQSAYMHAFDLAVRCGFGHWRIVTEYADDDVFEQNIRIKRLISPFSVIWDPNSKEYTKADADWCFVTEWYTKEVFKERWPDAVDGDWEQQFRTTKNWLTAERVRVAEYWHKEPYKKTLAKLENGAVADVTEIKDFVIAGAIPVARNQDGTPVLRVVNSHRVCRYLLSGHQILEKKQYFPSKYIPILSVYGPEEFVGDATQYLSLIRYAKDPMRMYSYWQTSITEKIALAPKAPFIVTVAQVAGDTIQPLWDKANRENRSYLPYNPDPGAPPPMRQPPASINAAEIQQSAQAIDDLKATMGIYDASLGNRGNETSGRAIQARQQQGDTATFAWVDNLARVIQHGGRILLDMIPQVMDTAQVARLLSESGDYEMVPINQVVQGRKINDITIGKYDLEITVGPSYATKRLEAIDSMMMMVQNDPEGMALVRDLLADEMDWPGAEKFKKRWQKALPSGMVEMQELSPEEQQAAQQKAWQDAAKQQDVETIMRDKELAEIALKKAEAKLTDAKAAAERAAAVAQGIENDLVVDGTIYPNGAPTDPPERAAA